LATWIKRPGRELSKRVVSIFTAVLPSLASFPLSEFLGGTVPGHPERKKNPQENSYTSRLLRQGKEKICQKLGEEM